MQSRSAASYRLWDGKHGAGCKCDPGFGGHDCSERRCEGSVRGSDGLSEGCPGAAGQSACMLVHTVTLTASPSTPLVVRLREPLPGEAERERGGAHRWRTQRAVVVLATDALSGLHPQDSAAMVRAALLRQLTGAVASRIDVEGTYTADGGQSLAIMLPGASSRTEVRVSAVSARGPMRVQAQSTAGGSGHGVVECGDRGVCDRESGMCRCFGGYGGVACELRQRYRPGATSGRPQR